MQEKKKHLGQKYHIMFGSYFRRHFSVIFKCQNVFILNKNFIDLIRELNTEFLKTCVKVDF